MSKVVLSGYLDKVSNSYPFSIFETGERLGSLVDIERKIKGFAQGDIVSRNSQSVTDYEYTVNNIPNLWQSINQRKTSQLSILADSGFILTGGSFIGSRKQLSHERIAFNHYTALSPSNSPALHLHLRPDAWDVSTNFNIYTYQNGVFFSNYFSDNVCQYVLFVEDTGMAYFAFSASFNAKVGTLPAGDTRFSLVGELEPFKLYAITATPSVARGVVKDKALKPLADCKIGAFRRADFGLVGTAVSGTDGSYEMPLAAIKGEELFMVCLDNEIAPDFQSVIYDRVVVA